MRKNKLFVSTVSQGMLPMTDDAVQIMFNNATEKTPEELGVKLMLAMCLYGLDAKITQALAQKSFAVLKADGLI